MAEKETDLDPNESSKSIQDVPNVAGEDPEKAANSDSSPDALQNDPNVVDWDGPDDPHKPVNWKNSRKAKNIIAICYLTFLTPLGSTMFAPAIQDVMKTFNASNPELASFVVSVWILGYFFGPLFLGPLSEIYGRLPVYLICNILFAVFNIACAKAPSLGALIAFRFLTGTCGSCPITIGAGTFGDTIKAENRGKIIAIWSLGPLLGPVLGPICGGFMGQSIGWRWICWVLAIAAGVGAVASIIFQEETYPPVLLNRKVKRLRKETGNPNLRSILDISMDRRPSQIFGRSIVRSLRLLFLSPIVAILSVYQGVAYGYMYLLFTTYPLVFQYKYGFSTGSIGLAYLGLGVGSLLGLLVAGITLDRLVKKLGAVGGFKPEHRLPPLIPGCFGIPIGLFWYGWSSDKGVHWIVPILGTVVIGLGINILMMCIATYLIDAHPLYEASATAASTATRSLIGAVLPLAGRSMYQRLGLGWGNSLLGFLALAMCPLPYFFYKYGERIRTNPRFQLKM